MSQMTLSLFAIINTPTIKTTLFCQPALISSRALESWAYITCYKPATDVWISRRYMSPTLQLLLSTVVSNNAFKAHTELQLHRSTPAAQTDVAVDYVYKSGRANLCTVTTGYHLCGQEHSLAQQDQSIRFRSQSSWDRHSGKRRTRERKKKVCVWGQIKANDFHCL